MEKAEQLYFQKIDAALKSAGIGHPVLLVDQSRLDHNIAQLKTVLDRGFDFRVVAKSLPSLPLLEYVMGKTHTRRLMCFHIPFLMQLVAAIPDADILMGKPMTIAGMTQFYRWLGAQPKTSFDPVRQLQWLVDSEERLMHCTRLAETLEQTLVINLEIDVGLRRGGISDLCVFNRCVRHIMDSPRLRLGGLMGYEAHIMRVPAMLGGPKRAEKLAKARYQTFVAALPDSLDASKLCLNAGGSTTVPLYEGGDSCNELAMASALVKPSDFCVATLEEYQPAAFIAAPVLKRLRQPKMPMIEFLSSMMGRIGVLPKEACFIYGGNWLASPCYPPDARRVRLFGQSSNQEMYGHFQYAALQPEDFMFFRPRQSEAVMLQFGDIAVYRDGKIREWWPVLDGAFATRGQTARRETLR